MQDFHTLQIWQKSHELTLDIYKVTKHNFPKEELFALTSQIRRASSSIACNIAEGCGRKTDADFSHFLQMAIGSCSEVEYQIVLAKDLNYINEELYESLTQEVVGVRRMIKTFRRNYWVMGDETHKLKTHNSIFLKDSENEPFNVVYVKK